MATSRAHLAACLVLVLTLVHGGHGGPSLIGGGRGRRGLSWANWSMRDNVPIHALQADVGAAQSVEDDDYYRTGVVFQLYTRQNPDDPELIEIYNTKGQPSTFFNPNRPTKVVVHGWMSDGASSCQLKRAFLSNMDVNFIAVNWTSIDTVMYPLARYAVPAIAQRVAYLLDFLRLWYNVPLSSIHVIGHSLGAHISGLAGSATHWGRVGRITGLDPAGPLFPSDPTKRLDKNDAHFVDVIHTCANILGYKEAIGHVDFFPNGGTCIQPGCAYYDLTRGTCSHNRGFDYFAESIFNQTAFHAFPCEGAATSPDLTAQSIVMGLATPKHATGTYCIRTRDQAPFALSYDEQLQNPTDVLDDAPDDIDSPFTMLLAKNTMKVKSINANSLEVKNRIYRSYMSQGGVDSLARND